MRFLIFMSSSFLSIAQFYYFSWLFHDNWPKLCDKKFPYHLLGTETGATKIEKNIIPREKRQNRKRLTFTNKNHLDYIKWGLKTCSALEKNTSFENYKNISKKETPATKFQTLSTCQTFLKMTVCEPTTIIKQNYTMREKSTPLENVTKPEGKNFTQGAFEDEI